MITAWAKGSAPFLSTLFELVLFTITLACLGSNVIASDNLGAKCDTVSSEVVEKAVTALDPQTAANLHRDLESIKSFWLQDRSYSIVKHSVAEIKGVRALVRLEIGGGRGSGYDSLWFIDNGETVLEISTASRNGRPWRGTIPRKEWDNYTSYLESLQDNDFKSMVSTTAVDAPIYIMCILLPRRATGLLVEDTPADVVQFAVIARTLAISRSKAVPREFANPAYR